MDEAIEKFRRIFFPLLQDFEKHMADLKQAYENGSKAPILWGVLACVETGRPIPDWCLDAFRNAFWDVQDWKYKSWDDVFGKPHPKGMSIDATRKTLLFATKVYLRVEELREAGQAADGALFEQVGKEFGIGGKTLTEQYYYQQKRIRKNIKGRIEESRLKQK
jgi:hypothetical protein